MFLVNDHLSCSSNFRSKIFQYDLIRALKMHKIPDQSLHCSHMRKHSCQAARWLAISSRARFLERWLRVKPDLSKVFLSKNMSLKVKKYCGVFISIFSDDNTECYSKKCIGR